MRCAQLGDIAKGMAHFVGLEFVRREHSGTHQKIARDAMRAIPGTRRLIEQ